MVVREALVRACAGSDTFVGEGRTEGGAVVVGVVGIAHVAVVVSVGGFDWSMRVCERESVVRRLTVEVKSPLGRRRMILGDVMECAKDSVGVGVFRTGCVISLGTDNGLDAGEFMAEGYFGIDEGMRACRIL